MVNARLGDWTELCGSRNVFSSQMLSLVDICTDSGMPLPRGQINRDCRRATLRTRKHSTPTSSIALDEGRDIGEGTGTPVNPKHEVAIDLTRDGGSHRARNRKK